MDTADSRQRDAIENEFECGGLKESIGVVIATP